MNIKTIELIVTQEGTVMLSSLQYLLSQILKMFLLVDL